MRGTKALVEAQTNDASVWVKNVSLQAVSRDVWTWEPRSGSKILFLDILVQK